MDEAARLSLLYGDSCRRNKGGWHSTCPQQGRWRCSVKGDDGGVGGQGRYNATTANGRNAIDRNDLSRHGSNNSSKSRSNGSSHGSSDGSSSLGDDAAPYGPAAELMYRELLWRFGTWPHLFPLSGPHRAGFKVVVLRRNFVRSVVSHNPKGSPWDGGLRSHALVLATSTTLLSAMLEAQSAMPLESWVSVDPDSLGHPALGVPALKLLVR